nr:radical SAM protein [Desulfobulbaceae bacterium]
MRDSRRNQQSPSTLFDTETGSFKKKWKDKLPVALVFPNSYYVGMSNLGFQIVYSLLNSEEYIVCERVFFEPGVTPHSIESNRPLKDFSVIMFSVSFEQDFPNVVGLLSAGGIEPFASKRPNKIGPGSPLVVGGGVATFINPEPLTPFFDFLVIGEYEAISSDLAIYLQRFCSSADKVPLLAELSHSLPGVYVPSLYTPRYKESGQIDTVTVCGSAPVRIQKIQCPEKDISGHSIVLTPETEFSKIHLVELGRGCSRGCRFCAAGYVYRRPRIWKSDAVIEAVKARPDEAGRVGLLGMEMASPDDVRHIAQYLLNENCSLSFSSLRADMISGSLLELLTESKLKTAVIAPDGGSERVRRVINKGITREDCLSAACSLVETGISTLKMYFMIGLPTEKDADLVELVNLVREVQEEINVIGRRKGRLSQIHLSINCFVPKAWTPFQFHAFEDVVNLKDKIKFLRKEFSKFHNLKISVDHPDNAYFQAVFARADRRAGALLPEISQHPKGWKKIFKKNGLDPSFYAMRKRDFSEVFPWDIIDHGIQRNYLWKEYQLALDGNSSATCGSGLATGKCRKCGVCK